VTTEIISHYRLLKKLGAGGMGVVYLAEDISLDRKVAIKLLSRSSMADDLARKRLIREAQAVARLEHPNICTVYEVSEEDHDCFIVMQFVEGQTLDSRLRMGQMDLQDVLDLAIQIADALTEAHSKGIIHRDIKPQNIMITPRGQVKVLDFGLAKVIENRQGSEEVSTESLLTSPGLIMGTVPYMSPEQARGEVLDACSDIFSFGTVLYEMISGRHPFETDNVTETIAAILMRDPLPLDQFRPGIPMNLQFIVTKTLSKDRQTRYQTVAAVLRDLRDVKVQPDIPFEQMTNIPMPGGEASTVTLAQSAGLIETAANIEDRSADMPVDVTSANRPITNLPIHYNRTAILLVMALASVLSIGIGLFKLITNKSPSFSLPPQIMKINRLTATGRTNDIAISPDGRYLAYRIEDEKLKGSIWVEQRATSTSLQITTIGPTVETGLTFSRDGNYIFYNDRLSCYRIPVLGGTPRKVIDDVVGRVTLSPDGSQIAFWRIDTEGRSLVLAKANGSAEQTLITGKVGTTFSPLMAWSPDGQFITCVTFRGRELTLVDIGIEDRLEKTTSFGTPRWTDISGIAWLQDGSGLIVSASELGCSNQIWYLPYPKGEAKKITNDMNDYYTVGLFGDGNSIVTIQREERPNIWVVPVADESHAQQITKGGVDGRYGVCWVSNREIAYISLANGKANIWKTKSDGSSHEPLPSSAEGLNHDLSVSPDGRYIFFCSYGENESGTNGGLWRINIDGSSLKQLVRKDVANLSCSPDGKNLIYITWDPAAIWQISVDGGDSLHLSDAFAFDAVVSPDGKAIAYNEGASKLVIIPVEGGKPIREFDTLLPNGCIRWTPDGHGLTYIDQLNGISNIWLQPVNGGPRQQLTHFNSDIIYSFDWSRDGKQLVCSRGTSSTDAVSIVTFKEPKP
jgi:eukaryotic-like serine/threonine-protein kinase